MKKIMIAGALAAAGLSTFAAVPTRDAQVYDVNLNVKTTVCKEGKMTKTIATLFNQGYTDVKKEKLLVRKQASAKIAGVIWGCDCSTIANPGWYLYNGRTIGGYLFWPVGGTEVFDVRTTRLGWGVFNRIDNGDKVEGMWMLSNRRADSVFALVGAGFGTASGTDCRMILKSMSGNFAGFTIVGLMGNEACRLCGEVCAGWDVCPCDGVVYDRTLTAAYGTWSIKFNSSATRRIRSTGRISTAYNKFGRKTADAQDVASRLEVRIPAIVNGTVVTASQDELWDDGEGIYEDDEHYEVVDDEDLAKAAYGVISDGELEVEDVEEYEGGNGIINALLDAS